MKERKHRILKYKIFLSFNF